jgi:chromosomal replication initiator protein
LAIVQRKARSSYRPVGRRESPSSPTISRRTSGSFEGAVKKLKAFQQQTGTKIDLNIAQNAVKDIYRDGGKKNHRRSDHRQVAKYSTSFPPTFTGKKRTTRLWSPRQIAMYISRELTTSPCRRWAKNSAGGTHTTVSHAVRHVEKEMAKNLKPKHIVLPTDEKHSGPLR